MNTGPDFSIIVPVCNKWELTRNCLSSIARHTPEYDVEVIVADNSSTDETAQELAPLGQALFNDRFLRLRFEENHNYGPACNAGATAASAPLLFFLNNDTIMTPGWAPPLMEAMRGEKAPGAVGPLLLYEDSTVQHLGVTLTPSGFMHLYRRFPSTHPVVRRSRHLQAITAAALLMPAGLFAECGGFYEGYVNGFEDMELCLRIREKGKTLACETASVIFHLESQTPGRASHDEHNSRQLRERCMRSFYVDLHHHGAQDGFSVCIDDLLDISLRLPPAEEASLTGEARNLSPTDWLRVAREHPFWVGGREMLAEVLEKQGARQEALQMRVEIADLLRTADSYMMLLCAAARGGHADIVAFVEKELRLIMEYKKGDKRIARRRVESVLTQTGGRADAFLESLYEEKLRSL